RQAIAWAANRDRRVRKGTRGSEKRDHLSRFCCSRILCRMPDFVDLRTNPQPPPSVAREPAAQSEELVDLVRLCSYGRVDDTERWVREGRADQALTCRREKNPIILCPIRAPIRENNPDLVLLLLQLLSVGS